MSEQENLNFEHKYILDWLKENTQNSEEYTLQNVRNPSAPFVQKVYINILTELGLSDSICNTQQAEFEILDEVGDHHDLYKIMLPLVSLQAACTNMLNQICGDGNYNFGLNDLMNPDPKRTQKFLSVLINFWMFCNSVYQKVDAAQKYVDEIIDMKKRMISDIENYRNKINQMKSRAVEEKELARSVEAESEELRARVEQLKETGEQLSARNTKLKSEIEEARKKTSDLEAEHKGLETERDNLQGIVDGAAAIQRLDDELVKMREELSHKETQKVQFSERISAMERNATDLNSMFEVVKQYSNEQAELKNLKVKIQEINDKLKVFDGETEEVESLIREEEGQINEKSEVLSKMKNQWSRRRQGKQEDLDRAKTELEAAKSSLDEEQLKAMELAEKVRDYELQSAEENDEMILEANQVRSQYAKILEAMEKFNIKMSTDMKKLSEAKKKLNESASAL